MTLGELRFKINELITVHGAFMDVEVYIEDSQAELPIEDVYEQSNKVVLVVNSL